MAVPRAVGPHWVGGPFFGRADRCGGVVMNPLKAIRNKCTECMGGDPLKAARGEVAQAIHDCVSVTCPLHHFRMGTNPFRKAASEKQKAAARQNISRARSVRADETTQSDLG